MKTRKWILLVMMVFAFASCKKEPITELNRTADELGYNQVDNSSGQLKIAVLSDLHFMDPSILVADGPAFQNYLARDPKLLEFSGPILDQVIKELKAEKPDIVLITGDLTKDGEKICHQTLVTKLQQLLDANMKVYVVPGNHDINNPDANIFNGANTTPTANITPAEFESIYGNYGFLNAISKDPNSLSYVAAPFPGVWIMSIDDNKYYESNPDLKTGGVIKPGTMDWIHQQMAIANENNITVLPIMHHGLVEHYTGQNYFDPGYVTDNSEAAVSAFIADGLKVIFTGHYHANDVTPGMSAGNTIYDIETGSLVTTPVPYRIVMLKNKQLDISTKHVTSIDATLPGGMDFVTYSQEFYKAHLDGYFTYLLSMGGFGISYEDAVASAPLFRDGFMAHVAGDEKISPAEQRLDDAFGAISPVAQMALTGFWTDLGIKDNNLHIVKVQNP
jgi:predicted phosphodiesterase